MENLSNTDCISFEEYDCEFLTQIFDFLISEILSNNENKTNNEIHLFQVPVGRLEPW